MLGKQNEMKRVFLNLCLLALPGVRTEHLKRVLSHPQALAQSDIILSKLGATRENVNGKLPVLLRLTLGQLVASNELRDAGAIASARAAEIYGLDILAERIQELFTKLIEKNTYGMGSKKSK
ncbi:hypothetical protein LOK49_LG03G03790 [Camellia lanceoleosa]|uniref:Uncharacterized protein n=1 Tax=Camellia lanceoleosa TaxID=1840588 RepID=A0ACC0IDT2_9ERIC|nr:hypothetical protein LOK49_LG03G03790 [Camellia lanceoleosa]